MGVLFRVEFRNTVRLRSRVRLMANLVPVAASRRALRGSAPTFSLFAEMKPPVYPPIGLR